MLNKNTYSEDFYWFVIFKIKKSEAAENENLALERCIRTAYLDSCRHIDYLYSGSEIDKMRKRDSSEEEKDWADSFIEAKDSFINSCAEQIKAAINVLISDGGPVNFDDWHKNLCKDGLAEAPETVFGDKGSGMTIGQRQKWINMTIKYMLLMGFWDDVLKPYMEYIHVPLDSYIIKTAKTTGKNGLGIQMSIPEWNNINDYENEYFEFQKCIRNECKNTTPIQWEWYAWLNSAPGNNL